MCEGQRNKRMSEDSSNYCINMIGDNTEKSPVDLRFASNQTPVLKGWTNDGVKNSKRNNENNYNTVTKVL